MFQRYTRILIFLAIVSVSAAGLHLLTRVPTPASAPGPSAEQLLALLEPCRQISNGLYQTDHDTLPTVPVCQLTGAVFWKADLDIDCDGLLTDICNANTDPWFQPDTTAHTSAGQPLDASTLPFVVIPGESSVFHYSDYGITVGSVVAVVYDDTVQYGVVGDTGPPNIIGEGSYALARNLGIDPDPDTGGVDSGVTYIVFQNSSVSPIDDHFQAARMGAQLANKLLQQNVISGH